MSGGIHRSYGEALRADSAEGKPRLSFFPLLVKDKGVRDFESVSETLARAQHAVTRALAESSTVAEASPKIFRALCETLGCDWGELWRVDTSENLLRCAQIWHPGVPGQIERGIARHAV